MSCTLHTDHPAFSTWTYSMTFDCLPRMALSETNLDLGSSVEGVFLSTSQRLLVDVFGHSESDVPRPRFACGNDIAIEEDGPSCRTKLADKAWMARYPMVLRLSDAHEKAPGLHTRSVDVSLPDGRIASANALWRYEYPIVVAPRYIDFGRVLPGGESGRRRMSLRSTVARAFRVMGVACEGAQATCHAVFDTKGAVAREIDMSLTVPADAERGPVSGKVKIETDEGSQRMVEVFWSMQVGSAGSGTPRARLPRLIPTTEEVLHENKGAFLAVRFFLTRAPGSPQAMRLKGRSIVVRL